MIFYLVNVDYERQTGEDNPGKVKESYLVNAANCSSAESTVLDYIKPYVFGDCETPQIKRVHFFEVFDAEDPADDIWYKAKVEMITIDGDKETRKVVNILIVSDGLYNALDRLCDKLRSYDCEIVSIQKTAIVDILKPEA